MKIYVETEMKELPFRCIDCELCKIVERRQCDGGTFCYCDWKGDSRDVIENPRTCEKPKWCPLRTEALTVNELSNYCKSDIKVISGFNDKILCKRFDKDKHVEIGEREVLQIWSEFKIRNSIWGNCAESIITACVYGGKEAKLYYEKKKQEKGGQVNEISNN